MHKSAGQSREALTRASNVRDGRRVTALPGERVSRAADATRAEDERRQRVLATVDSIPAGNVASYGQVAREAMLPGRARWVGRVLAQLTAGSQLAWHRVVNSSGRISFPAGSRQELEQRRRLTSEGVVFRPGGSIDLTRFGWKP